MRSGDPRRRHRRQRGVSLVEALVASGLLGIVAVVGLTAWDTAILGAKTATRKAWAKCSARSQLEAIVAAPWSAGEAGYRPLARGVEVRLTPEPGLEGELQTVTVRVRDPAGGGALLYEASALKARALSERRGIALSDDTVRRIQAGCPSP